MPVVGRTGCDGSGRGPPSIAAVLLCGGRGWPNGRWPCGRARLPVAACGGRGARRHDARRLRHHLALRLQRRRARRRLAGFFDAQANARRHEAAGLLARGLRGFGARRPRRAPPASARRAAPRQPARAPLRQRRCFDRRRRGRLDRRRPRRLFGLRLGRLRLLDQARRTERRRGGLRRLRRGVRRPSCRARPSPSTRS